ncbi:uncharacterized protein N7498_001729 [Penicillium cinerascens]|uniref:PNPLA domain-containing protein n=1 Tax=Penicillium cinerascens TaxID=70096 RepID=A0A9W9N8R9_9EURO|nr:uncharacterized protein N7498_001729 [Penicillium cinerascens]KAJ5215322.1 hypothetical protein N7498_001729 [Penicillium cinerascens]
MQSAQNLLQQPLRELAIGGNPVPASMQVVIVLTKREGPNVSAASMLANFHEVAETWGITVLDLRQRCGLSDMVTFEPLRNLIREHLATIRTQQDSTYCRFSVSHIGVLTAIDIFFNNSSWFASAFNLMLTGLYDSVSLSQTLKEAVTPERRIFDVATASPVGCRVAVVASRTSDGKACVLANYRGIGQRSAKAAYQFLVPNSSQENPSLSDVAMCSVAAPLRLLGFVPLQDGGVRANNPLAIALRESGIIWPSSKRHDLLLSVGTGVSTTSPDHDSRYGNAWDGALPRLFRAMMSSPSMDGQQGFFEALNYLPHHSKLDVFRLDQAIYGPLPELDDISALEEFSKMNFVVLDELVRTILALAMFFFELDATLVPSHVGYHCEGSILCLRPGAGEILARVLVETPGAKF